MPYWALLLSKLTLGYPNDPNHPKRINRTKGINRITEQTEQTNLTVQNQLNSIFER
jgi:hypothetical protein